MKRTVHFNKIDYMTWVIHTVDYDHGPAFATQYYKWSFSEDEVIDALNELRNSYNLNVHASSYPFHIVITFDNEADEAAFMLLANDGGITLDDNDNHDRYK